MAEGVPATRAEPARTDRPVTRRLSRGPRVAIAPNPRTKGIAMLRILLAGTVLAGFIGAASARPVVVELFTSEGCSSCPPADAYLTELSRGGGDVLPLAFHVTYWDRLGWRDPYGLAAATERQAAYGRRFGDGSYTPEMVVDGTRGLVGSERGEAGQAIAAAARQGRTASEVMLSRHGSRVAVSLGAGSGSGRVVLVGFDPQHTTAVGRGENTGRTLTESNIVRSVRTIAAWTGAPVALEVDAPAGQETAVLLEAPDGAIVGAGRL